MVLYTIKVHYTLLHSFFLIVYKKLEFPKLQNQGTYILYIHHAV